MNPNEPTISGFKIINSGGADVPHCIYDFMTGELITGVNDGDICSPQ